MKMIITAISNNGVVSKDGKIPFVTPATAHYFSELTKNSTIILGYNTWISMNETPMPGRKHIILTRNPFKVVNKRNVSSATCVEDVVTTTKGIDAWVVGGVSTFHSLVHMCDEVQALRSTDTIDSGVVTYLDLSSLGFKNKDSTEFDKNILWESYIK